MRRSFVDRADAGRLLAKKLATHMFTDPVVLALPRGGVPIGAEVARVLGAPLDLLLVRKIGVPGQRELAVAAIVDGAPHELVIDEEVQRLAGVGREYIDAQAQHELLEIERQRRLYLHSRPPVPVKGRTAIVVDDGMATGTSMRAALKALRLRQPARLVLAVPVAPHETIEALRNDVDDVVCLQEPSPFFGVGAHYDDFHQVGDDEVLATLAALPAH